MINDTVRILDNYSYVVVNDDGALIVDGIESWISGLASIGYNNEYLVVQDDKSGAVFEIKRVA